MIDTHTHIQFRAYAKDMDDVIARTQKKGVHMIVVGTQTDTSRLAVELANKHENMWAVVGLHPSHCHRHTLHVDENESIKTRAETFDKDYYRDLISSSNKVVAIGEVGLDYYRLPDRDKQEVIDTQKIAVNNALELANELDLPVVLHVRDAHDDMLDILAQFVGSGRLKRRGVVHCYTGTLRDAVRYHDLGFLTSFTGIVTFEDKKNPGEITPLMAVAKDVPLEWMMVETDSPYLTPQPHRGERCEPWMTKYVAQKIADLKSISIDEVERVTDNNAKQLFKIEF